jgi:hypothetical protein
MTSQLYILLFLRSKEYAVHQSSDSEVKTWQVSACARLQIAGPVLMHRLLQVSMDKFLHAQSFL